MIKSFVVVFLLLFICSSSFSQEVKDKKIMNATRVTVAPKIDGVLDDEAWAQSETISDFIQHQPNPGQPSERNSEVKLVYDNSAIYIAGYFYETSPDSIMKELSKRDELGNVDYCAFIFDTYSDGINGFGFFLTASGVQLDAKYSDERGEDFTWDAVWESKVNIVNDGWIVEVKIPYSAIRFPKQKEQVWGFNAERVIRRTREMSFWNFIDPKVNGIINQSGRLIGISDIESPLRLSFTPYISTTVEHYPYNLPEIDNTSYKFGGGMDVKYGINESFTLDMTLIPDFSQVQSDNHVLNLSPFEIQYVENRPFFTEGTELFSKGGLFYSRRVGGRPLHYFNVYSMVEEGETVVENPAEAQLLNATKISGRTNSGLGIGFFNATSAATHAKIRSEEGGTREVLTQPLTNYNIFVFDQSLKNNSFISLVNTTVLREGDFYDANVTGVQFKIADKKNTYAIMGDGAVSQIYDAQNKTNPGHKYFLQFRKISGNFQYGIWHNLESDTYNPNDLGLLFSNNEKTYAAFARYNTYEPRGKFLNTWSYLEFNYARLYAPDRFQNFYIYSEVGGTFKNYLSAGIWTALEPVITYDFYEPRVAGRYYTYPRNYNFGGFISSDYRKKLALDISGNYRIYEDRSRVRLNINVSPRWRVNDKLSFIYSFGYSDWPDDVGFVNKTNDNDSVWFGYRDVYTYTNTISGSYKFNNLMALTMRIRHYWSKAVYNDFVLLDDEGLMQHSDYDNDHNVSFNAFNIDMIYTWRFAPGSELNIIWKNAILQNDNQVYTDFYHNFRHTIRSPQANNLSLKLIYYLDYQVFTKKRR